MYMFVCMRGYHAAIITLVDGCKYIYIFPIIWQITGIYIYILAICQIMR